MAESYRGLTIRIGGDTTKLQQALKSANGAITQTNQELRKIKQSLNIDPGNVQAFNLQLGYMSNQATNVAMKLASLRDAANEIGKTKVTIGSDGEQTIEQVARATEEFGGAVENMSLKLATSRSELATLTSRLAEAHTNMSRLTEKAAEFTRVKIEDAFKLSAGLTSVDKLTKKYSEELPNGVRRSKEQVAELIAYVTRVSDVLSASGGVNMGALTEALSDLPDSITLSSKGLASLSTSLEKFETAHSGAFANVKGELEGIRDDAATTKKSIDEITKGINDAVSGAQVEGEQMVNEAIAQGNKLIEDAVAAEKDRTAAIAASEEAQKRLVKAERDLSAALNDEDEKYREMNAAFNAAHEGLESEISRETEAVDGLVSSFDKAKESLVSLLSATDDRLASDDESAIAESWESAFDRMFKAKDEYEKSADDLQNAYEASTRALADGVDEAYEKLKRHEEELKSIRDRNLKEWTDSIRHLEMVRSESDIQEMRSALDNATKIRETYEQVALRSNSWYGSSETGGVSFKDSVKQEIDAANALIDGYRNRYKTVLASLRRELKDANKEGNEGLAAELESRIKSVEFARNTVVNQLKSHIKRLETELESVDNLTSVIFKKNDDGSSKYEYSNALGIYDQISEKISETTRKRDAEKAKIDETVRSLTEAGRSQEEITAATADSVAELDRLNRELAEYKSDLSAVSGGKGQNLTAAFKAARSDTEADRAATEEAIATAHREYLADKEAADKKYDEARERFEAAEQKRDAAQLARDKAKAEAELKERSAQGDGTAVEEARAKAVEMRAKAEQDAANHVREAIEQQDDEMLRLIQTQSAAEDKAKSYESAVESVVKAIKGMVGDIGNPFAEVFTNERGNTDVKLLDETLRQIASDLGLSNSEMDEFVAKTGALVKQFNEADTANQQLIKVTQYQDLVSEIMHSQAAVKNLAETMASMNMPSEVMRGMYELTEDTKVLDSAYRTLSSTGKSLADSFKADPSNIDALDQAMNSYAAAEMVAVENARKFATELSRLDGDRIAEITDGTKSATSQLMSASKAATEAKQRYAELMGQIEENNELITNLSVEPAGIATSEAEHKKWLESAEARRVKVLELEQANALLNEQAKEALETQRAAFEARDNAKMRKEYEDAAADAQRWRTEIELTRDAMAEISKQKMAFEIVGDTTEIDRLGTELESAAKKAKALDEAVKLDPTNMDRVAARTRAYDDVAAIAAKRTDLINQKLKELDHGSVDRVRKSFSSTEEAVRKTSDAAANSEAAFKKARSALSNMLAGTPWEGMVDDVIAAGNAMDTQLHPAIVKQKNDVLELKGAWEQAEGAMRDAVSADAIDELSGKLASTAATANLDNTKVNEAAFTQALSQISQYAERAGRAVVESANTIDTAYRDMRKTVNATESEFESIRNAAIEFSQTHVTSADQILEMEALGGQLGIAASALQSFGENASNLLIATDFDNAEELALKLGQITNVMSDLDDTTFDNFADALVRLGNNTATTESQIMNVAQRMSSVANVTSMTTPQLLAWSAAIASTGQRSESAATAINNTITGISAAVSEGGNTLNQFAAIAGMSADEFEKAWRTSSSDALEAFVKGLSNLTEDSTDAIQALDAVGISSVRQETALLGLSQTIENLDASIQMSQDAFDGVDDQWGAAGDAAREAQRKSEGFSGALQIMKNNAMDLAATLGESLVMPIQAVTAALQWLKALLDAVPGPVRDIVVTVGGLTIAFGTLAPLVKTLTDGWKAMLAQLAVGKLTGFSGALRGVGTYIQQFVGMVGMARAEGMSFASAISMAADTASYAGPAIKSLGMSLAAFGGITAAVAVIGMLITAISNAVQQAQRLSDAKDALSTSTDRLSAAANGAAGAEREASSAISDVKVSADDAASAIEEMARRQDELAESMERRNHSFQAQSAIVQQAMDAIREHANASNQNFEAQSELVGAVQMLNQELGTTYEVVDAANGIIREQGSELNLTADAIESYVQKQMQLAESQAIIESMEEAYKKLYEVQDQLAEEREKLNEYEKASSDNMGSYVASTREAAEASAHMASQHQQVSFAMQNQRDVVSGLEQEVASYESALESLGLRYGDLQYAVSYASKEQVDSIAEAASSISWLGAALESNGTSIDQFAQHFAYLGGTTEDFKNLTQHQLIAIASAYKGSISQIRSALDTLGITFSKTMGQTKTSVPKTYTTNDPEYKQRKKELDQAYKDQKKIYDKAYKDRKKQLDDTYKQQQKALDKEYKAAQKASQKYLKDYKKAQDEQVDAFKKATEARIKLLDEEYEAKKKLLEDEYSKYDTGIDDRIKAIEDEQDAEDRAEKQREREEKVAELQKDVQRAKTRKKRAEAEKALNDYLADIEKEYRKEDRQAQIEALKQQKSDLKDELSEKQEILKDSYDNAKSEYKESRDAELKVLQESLEAAYEMQQEAQQEQLEALKESNSARLEAIKEAQSDELEAMKEQHSEWLEALKEQNEQTLENFKQGLDELGNALEDTADTLDEKGSWSKKVIDKAGDSFKQLATDAYDSVAKMLGAKTLAERNSSEMSDAIIGPFESLPDKLGTRITEAGNFVSNFGRNGETEAAAQGARALRDAIESPLSEITGFASMTAMDASAALSSFGGEEGVKTMVANVRTIVETVLGQMKALPDGASGIADETGGKLALFGGQDTVNLAARNSATLYDAILEPFLDKGGAFETATGNLSTEVSNGMAKNSDKPVGMAETIARAVLDQFRAYEKSFNVVGTNFAIGINNGLAAGAKNVNSSARSVASNVLKTVKNTLGIRSPSREAMKLMGYFGEGMEIGLRDAGNGVSAEAGRLSQAIMDGIDVTPDTDFVQKLVDQMRSKEDVLYEQSKRMSDIVENGFDPSMSLAAATDAIDRIDAGKLRREQLVASSSNVDNSTYAPVINITIPEMVIREEADVDRVSRAVATKVQRALSSKIG